MDNIRIYSNSLVTDGTWAPEEGKRRRCWHCLRSFDHMPVPVPTNYDEQKRKYYVTGVFCSFPCAKAYMINRVGYCSPITMMWLTQMAKHYFGYQGLVIHPAPTQEWILSGAISDEELDKICQSGKPCETLRNTLIPACVLESSSLMMVQNKPSVTLQDLISTRNNESEVQQTQEPSKETESTSTSMYGNFLLNATKESGNTPVESTAVAPEPTKKKARKKQKRVEPSTSGKRVSSLASFIRK